MGRVNKEAWSRVMRSIRSKDTNAEITFRKEPHRAEHRDSEPRYDFARREKSKKFYGIVPLDELRWDVPCHQWHFRIEVPQSVISR